MPVYLDEGGAVYNVAAYTEIVDAIVAADPDEGGPGGTVYFPGGIHELSSDLTVPVGVGFTFAPRARLRTNGHTLSVNGTIRAGLYSVIEDLGANATPIVFANGTVEEVRPEWFGAVADGAVDCAPAIQAAVDSLPESGGIVRFAAGHYRLDGEVLISKHGVHLRGGVRQGKPGTPDSGSFLTLGGEILETQGQGRGAMIRFGQIPHPNDSHTFQPTMGCSVTGLSFTNEPNHDNDRRFMCDAALDVEASDAFTLSDCTFTNIKGRALRLTRSVQSHFANVKVYRCGAADRPAVHIDGIFDNPLTTPDDDSFDTIVVQNSVLRGFRIEGCFDAPYLAVDSTGSGHGENAANKFDDIGFEGYEGGNTLEAEDCAQTFLAVGASRNQFGKLHFNRTAAVAAVPKLSVTADRCSFGELLFTGVKGPAGSAEIAGSYNTVDAIVLRSAQNDPDVETEIRINGDGNRIGSIRCDPHEHAVGDGIRVGGIAIKGTANVVQSIGCRHQRGLVVSGIRNVVRSFTSTSAPTTALRVDGSLAEIAYAHIESCLVDRGPVVEVVDPPYLIPGWVHRGRVRVRVVDAPFAAEGVLVAATDVQLLPGSAVENVRRGYGLRWRGARGGWSGLHIADVGKDGILVDGGTPLSMTDFTIRRCNRYPMGMQENLEWGGFRATAPRYPTERASCTGFTIREDGSTHAYSFQIDPSADSGGTSHERWQIQGNVSDGGPVSIPATQRHGVDFDSEGVGDTIPVKSTTIAMPDSANLAPIEADGADLQTITASWPGRRVILLFTTAQLVESGTGNLKLSGATDFSATADDTLTLVCDGEDWFEVGRSVN